MSIELNSNNTCTGSLFEGNREEIQNVQLDIIDGQLPEGINGIVYFQSQCGNPNSGGLPFPKDGPDWGSPVLNGDGMVFKIDFSEKGKAYATSRLMKNPAYYADLATSNDGDATKDSGYEHFAFKNYGIVRMNLLLGAKNTINTALIPVHFENDSSVCLLSTNDVSRPWKMDPVTLELVTPIGENKEWVSGFPPLMQTPIPMFQTTAHPSYDPITKEIYLPNWTKSSETETADNDMTTMMHMEPEKLKKHFEDIASSHKSHQDDGRARKELLDILKKSRHEHRSLPRPHIFKKIIFFIITLIKKIIMLFFGWAFTTYDNIFLYSWSGEGKMKKNKLVDKDGKSLTLMQCMHQTSLTENYIVLMDSSFKFAFSLLITDPFEDDELNLLLRRLLGKTVLDTTAVWIVNRNDLRKAKHKAKVTAHQLINEVGGLPAECVHFSTEYDDSNDEIVLYSAQNNSSCLAEWVRLYDTNKFTKEKPIDGVIGDYAVGELDINSIGKYVIDTKTMTLSKIIEVQEEGNLPPIGDFPVGPIKDIGPNTWGIGLYAYRDMIDPKIPNRKIEDLYFVNFGANPTLLTDYIYSLYSNRKERTPEELAQINRFMKYSEKGIPPSIMSIETENMTFTGNYEFAPGTSPVSIQFIPMVSPTSGVKQSQDGYIFLTMKVCVNGRFTSQLWLFEAWDLKKGPICKMKSKDLNYCSPLHSIWLPEAKPLTSGYSVDIEKDFEYTIKKSFLFFEKDHYQSFFNKYVFPYFKK